MFLGTYEPNLIGPGRIALPKKVRSELVGERLVLTIGFEKCIFGFNEKDWDQIVQPELSRPLFSDQLGRDLRRQMCMEAMVITLDSQGRFIIPDTMLDYAQVTSDLVIIGAGDHFEIWSKNHWSDYKQRLTKPN